jgi:hypothetical protein
MAKIENMLLMITCQPMARYLSGDCFRSRFHKAWRIADEINRVNARKGMGVVNVS